MVPRLQGSAHTKQTHAIHAYASKVCHRHKGVNSKENAFLGLRSVSSSTSVNGDLRLCQILTHYFSFSRSCERKPGSYRTISLSLALALFSSLSLALSPSMHPILLATRGIKFVAPWRGDLLCRRQVCDERFGLCISAVSFVTGVCRCAPLCVFSRSCVCVCTRARAVVCLPLDWLLLAPAHCSHARASLSR